MEGRKEGGKEGKEVNTKAKQQLTINVEQHSLGGLVAGRVGHFAGVHPVLVLPGGRQRQAGGEVGPGGSRQGGPFEAPLEDQLGRGRALRCADQSCGLSALDGVGRGNDGGDFGPFWKEIAQWSRITFQWTKLITHKSDLSRFQMIYLCIKSTALILMIAFSEVLVAIHCKL